MPRKQYRKQPARRHRKGANRHYKKKAKYQKAVITRMKGTGFSDSVFARLTYSDCIQLAPGAPKVQYTFRGNSLFDPDYTAVGHQPLYFDQYALIYNKYRVMGCSIRVDSVATSGVSAAYFVCIPSTEILTLTSISAAIEQNRSKAPKILPVASRGPEGRIKQYCSTRKVCGLTKPQLSSEDYSALVSASPNNVWYWNLFYESIDNSTNVTINFIVKLVYYVQFFDRTQVAQS